MPPMTDDHGTDVTGVSAPTVAATVTDLFAGGGKHHIGKLSPDLPPGAGLPFYPMYVRDVTEHDKVIMYGEIVDILGEPFRHDPLSGPCELAPGWVHVPMRMGGRECAPGEPGDLLVAVRRQFLD